MSSQLPTLARAASAALLALPALACGNDMTKASGGATGDVEDAALESGAQMLADRFDGARAWTLLERIVAIGPRPSGSSKNAEQRDLIEAELEAAGLDVVRETFQDDTPIGKVTFENLYADLGDDAPDAPMIVLATHFDTKRIQGIDFVGANDGGSGTAVLLELARVLADREGPVTWRLLFLDGEEAVRPDWVDPDNRYGSRYHVERLEETGELARVKAMVLLDMVGDANLQFVTDASSTPELLHVIFESARRNGLGQHVYGRRQPILDDHLSFLQRGIPAVDLIDFEYGPANQYWHSPDDTLENCSQASLDATGRIVLHAVPALEAWVLER